MSKKRHCEDHINLVAKIAKIEGKLSILIALNVGAITLIVALFLKS